MRVWIDLANSPHVAAFVPVVGACESRATTCCSRPGITRRPSALAAGVGRRRVSAAESPPGRLRKGPRSRAGRRRSGGSRATERPGRRALARLVRPDRRGARRPRAGRDDDGLRAPAREPPQLPARPTRRSCPRFPDDALRRFGARGARSCATRASRRSYTSAASRPVRAVGGRARASIPPGSSRMRPPPEGALYHRVRQRALRGRPRQAAARDDRRSCCSPARDEQAARYAGRDGRDRADAAGRRRSLLAYADAMIGGGRHDEPRGGAARDADLHDVRGRLAAVDAELIRRGLMHDLRGAEADLPSRRSRSATRGRRRGAERIRPDVRLEPHCSAGAGSTMRHVV